MSVLSFVQLHRPARPRLVRQGSILLSPTTLKPPLMPIIADFRMNGSLLEDIVYDHTSNILPATYTLVKSSELLQHATYNVIIERFYLHERRLMLLLLVRYRYTTGYDNAYINVSGLNILRSGNRQRMLVEINRKIVSDYLLATKVSCAPSTILSLSSNIANIKLAPYCDKESCLINIKSTIGQILQLEDVTITESRWLSQFGAMAEALPSFDIMDAIDKVSMYQADIGWLDEFTVTNTSPARSAIDNTTGPSLLSTIDQLYTGSTHGPVRIFYDPETYEEIAQRITSLSLTDFSFKAQFSAGHEVTGQFYYASNRYAAYYQTQWDPYNLVIGIAERTLQLATQLSMIQEISNQHVVQIEIVKSFTDEALIIIRQSHTHAVIGIYLDLVLCTMFSYSTCEDFIWGDIKNLRDVSQWH